MTPLIIGMDIGVSCAIFLVYLSVHTIAELVPKSFGGKLTAAVTFSVHFVTISLVSLSMKINQIYGVPLDLEHFREAGIGRLSDAWKVVFLLDSIYAYLNADVVILFIFGCALYWIFPRYLSPVVPRYFRWKRGAAVWVVTAMVMVLMPATVYSGFTGRHTYGLKTNALSHIFRSYTGNWVHRTPRIYDQEDFDAEKIIADLEQDLAGTSRGDFWDQVSLHAEEWRLETDLNHFQGVAKGFNVILIVLESTSSEHLDRESSPNIFRLVERGLSFENYFTAATISYDSLYSIFYSDYIISLGAPLRHVYQGPLPQPALPSIFVEAEYDTGLFQTSWLEFLDTGFLWEDQGLDTIKGAEDFKNEGGNTWKWGAFETQTMDALTEWIESRKSDNFFAAYIPVFPHHPYSNPMESQPFSSDTVRGRHRNALFYTDLQIGRLLDYLDQQDLTNNTLLVVTGDHGESLLEGRSGHGLSYANEEIRVPLIISNPVLFPKAIQKDVYANHLDLAPTVAALAGLQSPEDWKGRNLLPERIRSRVLYLSATLSRTRGLIDQGILYVERLSTGESRLWNLDKLDGGNSTPLPDKDGRTALDVKYRELMDGYEKSTVLSHLKRALDCPCVNGG